MQTLIVLLLVMTGSTMHASAQSAPCPDHPETLTAMRDCYRPLLVSSRSSSDVELVRQLQELNAHAPALLERDVRVIVLTADPGSVPSDLLRGLPTAHLGAAEQQRARAQFDIRPGQFTILLIGKDGSEKMRRNAPVTVRDLGSRIDSMPMRQQEMKHPAH